MLLARTKKCPKRLSYEACEVKMAEETARRAVELKGRAEASSELFQKLTRICADFIRKTKTVVYGGTAINDLLPKPERFYNPEVDLPDYDIYSPTPIDHAKTIVDMFIKEGFEHVEAKSAVHFGTYKVFVNFVGALDITLMPPKLFELVQKRALKRNGILYAHPDLLRQAMYIELANPIGDVDRWKKVLPRLHKLNKAYPLKPGNCTAKTSTKKGVDGKLQDVLESVMISEKVVFLGGMANSFYLAANQDGSEYYDIIAEDPASFIKKATPLLKAEGYTDVSHEKHAATGELVGAYHDFKVGKKTVAHIFEPTRCYARNEVEKKGETLRIASFDTLLSFYFAFLYAKHPKLNKTSIMCTANALYETMRNNNNKGLERFPVKCYGKQETLRTLRAHKWKLRRELKKGTVAYNRWFFRYSPDIPSAAAS